MAYKRTSEEQAGNEGFKAVGDIFTDALRFVGGGLNGVFGTGGGSAGIDPTTQNLILQMQIENQRSASQTKQILMIGGLGIAALLVITIVK